MAIRPVRPTASVDAPAVGGDDGAVVGLLVQLSVGSAAPGQPGPEQPGPDGLGIVSVFVSMLEGADTTMVA